VTALIVVIVVVIVFALVAGAVVPTVGARMRK
jgi:hypothetical protein